MISNDMLLLLHLEGSMLAIYIPLLPYAAITVWRLLSPYCQMRKNYKTLIYESFGTPDRIRTYVKAAYKAAA